MLWGRRRAPPVCASWPYRRTCSRPSPRIWPSTSVPGVTGCFSLTVPRSRPGISRTGGTTSNSTLRRARQLAGRTCAFTTCRTRGPPSLQALTYLSHEPDIAVVCGCSLLCRNKRHRDSSDEEAPCVPPSAVDIFIWGGFQGLVKMDRHEAGKGLLHRHYWPPHVQRVLVPVPQKVLQLLLGEDQTEAVTVLDDIHPRRRQSAARRRSRKTPACRQIAKAGSPSRRSRLEDPTTSAPRSAMVSKPVALDQRGRLPVISRARG